MSAEFLVDTSAWNRSNASAEVSTRWTDLVVAEKVALCPPVRLELLYSARGPADYAAFADQLDGLTAVPLSRRAVDRATDVQASLAQSSQDCGPNPVDLYVAAIAELNDLIVIHYDRHFDAIACATGQPSEWIAPRGTLD